MKTTLLLPLALVVISCTPKNVPAPATVLSPEHQRVYDALRLRDSLLFSFVFDHCDTASLRSLISEDFEFYHDQNGITASRSAFFKGVAGLGNNPYKTRRVVAANSLKVFPLYNKGQLYGAIQTGRHHFIAVEPGKPERLTSTAVFSHLWLLEKGNWKLKRVLSYDHQAP